MVTGIETTGAMRPADALAHVLVFAYMRPEHLRRTIESLLANPESARTHVTIYCDAAKRPEHREAVDEVRRYVASVGGFASVTRVVRAANMGLAASIIDGVTDALRTRDRVIVVEDDLLLSPHFLKYMNDGLDTYAQDERVASIHGYWYPTDTPLPETFFLKGADCWGWATWSRAWRHFEPDGARLLEGVRRRGLAHEIDYDGTFPHMRILARQMAGRNDSWAIRWHLSVYLRDMVTLYPSRSVVDNIGHDDSGTHCGASDAYSGALATRPIDVVRSEPVPSAVARATAIDFFRQNRESLPRKVVRRLRQRLATLHQSMRTVP